MAHFAELDENNVVIRVIVVHNNELLDENGVGQEQKGIDFCVSHFGGRWLQTSYNGNFRANYAGEGYVYDPDNDVFIAKKWYPSWVLNETTWDYDPPVSYPTDGNVYYWDENTVSWVQRT